MHDDYETINLRGLEALKKNIFDCKRTVRTIYMMEELWKSSYARQVGRHKNENDERCFFIFHRRIRFIDNSLRYSVGV